MQDGTGGNARLVGLAARAARMLDAAPCPALAVHADGALLFANAAARQRFGAKAEDEPLREIATAARAALEQGSPRVLLELPTGLARFDVTTTELPLDEGVPDATLLFFAEPPPDPRAARPEDQALLQKIVDAIPAPIFYKDHEGRYQGGNTAFSEYLGIPLGRIVGSTVFEVAPRDLASVYHEADLALMKSGGHQRYETQVRDAEGRRRDVLFTKATFTLDGNRGLVGTMLDISDRRAAERLAEERAREAHEAERALRTLLDALPEAVFVWQEGKVAFANEGARALGAAQVEELARLGREDVRASHEVKLARADGTTATVEVTLVPLPLGGRMAFAIAVRDVTERRAFEARMAITDRLASVGTLAGGVAHEINNPLTYVGTNIVYVRELLASGRELTPLLRTEIANALTDAENGVSRAVDTVRNLRTFARNTPPVIEAVRIRDAVESAARLASAELRRRATLSIEVDPECRATADVLHLSQVFLNLLLNAAQAMPERHPSENRVTVRAAQHGSHVRVTVEDNGRGIPKELTARVFDPFFTTKPVGEGTGLGLAFCHDILRRLGGTITLTSEQSAGTTVTIELPSTDQ